MGWAGGAIGTYFSIKSTLGPRERSFMVKVSAIAWVAITAFPIGLLTLPKPYNFLLWVSYGIALPLGIRWWNRRQLRVRGEEGDSRASETRRS
jgi:hypothetical protein